MSDTEQDIEIQFEELKIKHEELELDYEELKGKQRSYLSIFGIFWMNFFDL